MRIQTCLALTFLLLLSAPSPSEEGAQSVAKNQASAPRAGASAKCHRLVVQFQDKNEDFFAQQTDAELSRINDSIYECATDSHSHLTTKDIVVLVATGAVVARQIQARADAVAYGELQKRYDRLAATASKPSRPHTVTLTISPLPNGFTRQLSIVGHENTCVALESMQITCTINGAKPGTITIPTRLVAMLATPKPLPMFEHSFLIGCNPGLSSNCSSLVPGDYDAEYVGMDGISISGLISEDKPNEPLQHAIFVIYHRGESP